MRMIVILKDPSATVILFLSYIWGAGLEQMFYVFTQWMHLLKSYVLKKRGLWYGIPTTKLVFLKRTV
jgi:hypothetical protein